MGSTVFFLPDDSGGAAEKPDRRIYCPTDALVGDGEREYVWLVDRDQRIAPADVNTGNANDGQTEVLGGLSGGERVILRPPPDLRTGQRVKVAE
jgi:multidrug efflux pump subunit AcrA (membrane-fusion protein)